MFQIREMTAADYDLVLPMVLDFYNSPAVEHPVDQAVLERSCRAAADPGEPFLRGLVLMEDGAPAGYCYLTECYSAEVGGRTLLIEELYFLPACRGKGYGAQVLEWILSHHLKHIRFRLEVTEANENAARLYQRIGFRYLEYDQMVLDRTGRQEGDGCNGSN